MKNLIIDGLTDTLPLKKVGNAHFQMKQCFLQEVKDELYLTRLISQY
ncbi:MAG: hypothetical protein WBA13_23480 [Microcoleaceae cyanobacterium]